jgi:hypothetical protein
MYTWVDKDGITNVSNVPPPEDVRVTKVARTAPRDPAREAATRQAEMRALRERVDELSKEVEQSRAASAPPPDAPPPVMAYAPPPAAPTVVVTVVNQPAQPEQPDVTSAGCAYTFGGCGLYFPGYTYYVPPVQRGFHKPQQHHRGRATPARQGFGTAHPLIPPLIPYPARQQTAGAPRLG